MSINRIDMEDITTRYAELRDEREALADTITDGEDDTSALDADELTEARQALKDWEEANGEELAELEELLEELRGAGGGDHQFEGDWYPRELIDADDFEEYAEELASDCYDIPDTWPHRCIDWKQAARELSQDYSTVSFRGSDYYWR